MQAGHGTCAEDSFSLQRFAACGVRGDVLLFNTVCVTTWQCSSAGSSVALWKDKPAGISQWMELLTDLKSNVSSQNRLATHLNTTLSNSEIVSFPSENASFPLLKWSCEGDGPPFNLLMDYGCERQSIIFASISSSVFVGVFFLCFYCIPA